MYGELPTTPVVMAACDSAYFIEHGPSFVYSANNVNKDVHVHIVNPTDEVLSLGSVLNATTEVRVTYTYNNIDHDDWSQESIRTYYACLRFLVAPNILSYCKSMLILDIDGMLMQSFDYPKKRVAFFPREPLPGTVGWEAEGTRVAAGAVYYHKDAYDVAILVAEEITKLPKKWFADQIALSTVMSSVKDDHIHHFDSQFMDWEFKKGTTIWTGKGPRKYNNPTYVAEKNRWMDCLWNVTAQYNKVILKPRLDIPFKRFGIQFANKGKLEPIREHWKNFVEKQTDKNTLVVESPRWTFNNTIQKYFPSAKMLVPHEEMQSWNGNDNTLYYMQTVFPWLFTIDPEGWGGGGSYLKTYNKERPYTEHAYRELQKYIKKGSKFQHLQSKQTDWSGIEKDNYIIVPLQLPHDDTIRWHSDFTVEHFVSKICHWVKTEAPAGFPQIVFKGHPVNLSSMEPIKKIINKWKDDTDMLVYIEHGNFQELVEQSQGVYVLNGGSGQEAMLLGKKVVCFGRSDYAPAVIQGDIDRLSNVWYDMSGDNVENRLAGYMRWFDWYINYVVSDSRI